MPVEFRFANKEFSWYWPHIMWPLIVLVVWSLAAFITALVSMQAYSLIFTGLNGIIVQLAVFGFVGYFIIETNKKATPGNSAWAGALIGIIAGFIGAILGLLMIQLIPSFLDAAVQQAVAQGASEDMVMRMSTIMAWVGLVTGPVFGGLVGALIAWASGAISNKVING